MYNTWETSFEGVLGRAYHVYTILKAKNPQNMTRTRQNGASEVLKKIPRNLPKRRYTYIYI